MSAMRCAVLACLCFVLSSDATDAAVVKNISTGISNTTGQQLPDFASDPDYVLTASTSPQFIGQSTIVRSNDLPPTYVPDSASTASRWIGIHSGQGAQQTNLNEGNHTLRTTVDLTGFEASTAVLNGRYTSDDIVISLRINGTAVITRSKEEFGDQLAFIDFAPNLGAGLFRPGLNTIDFEIYNLHSPMMLRVEASVTAAVPEPAAGSVAGVVAALALLRRGRRA
jgi:hypothetical protein